MTDLPNDDLADAPWPAMRGDRQNTGRSPSLGLSFRGERLAVVVVADTALPDSVSTINATPVMGPGDTILVGSADGRFHDFRPHDGRLASHPIGSIIDSAAVWTSVSCAYFASGDFTLFRYRQTGRDTPAELTRLPMTPEYWSPTSIYWFEGNVVANASGLLFAGNDDFYLYCLDPRTPDRFTVWAYPTGFFIWSAPAFSFDEQTLYVLSTDMRFHAVNVATGERDYAVDIGNFGVASPTVGPRERVYFGAFDGVVYGVDTGARRVLWTYPTPALIYASTALGPEERLYVHASDGVLRCLDVRDDDPQLRWEAFLGAPSFSSPSLAPDPEGLCAYLIVVGTGNGQVVALQPDGIRRWTYASAELHRAGREGSPAFWSDYRYPSINASIAVGRDYLATATSSGQILAIPHTAYLEATNAFDRHPKDVYLDALRGGPRFAAVASAGYLAEFVLPDELPTDPEGSVDRGQAVGFAALSISATGDGTSRTSFASLSPDSVRLFVDGRLHDDWALSPDGTQIFVHPSAQWDHAPFRDYTIAATTVDAHPLHGALRVAIQPTIDPWTPDRLRGARFVISQMSPHAPFVVPALDQLGIASTAIHVRILRVEGEHIFAYGFESFDPGAIGTPRRDLLYVFSGHFRDGLLLLETESCYFELTALPVPIQRLGFSASLTARASQGLSMRVDFAASWSELFDWANWLLEYYSEWGGTVDARAARDPAAEIRSRPPTRGRLAMLLNVARFVQRGVVGRITRPWRLLNERGTSAWQGTYRLREIEPPPTTLRARVALTIDHGWGWGWRSLNVEAILPGLGRDAFPVLGVVVLDARTGAPVLLNYVDRLDDFTYERRGDVGVVRAVLTLPERGELPTDSVVLVMLDLEIAASFDLDTGERRPWS